MKEATGVRRDAAVPWRGRPDPQGGRAGAGGSAFAERRAGLERTYRVLSATFLASSLAHELSQPMTAINVWASSSLKLVEQNADARDLVAERLALLEQESRRATEIIRKFRRTLSARTREISSVDLKPLLATMAALIEEEAAESDVRVAFEPDAAPCIVHADPELVELAVYILGRNALDALQGQRREPREIAIRARAGAAGTAAVLIADTGPGVESEIIPRLFEPFATAKPHGAGIGLALCRTVTESLGGRAWLESSSGNGAVFAFELPAVPEGGRDGSATGNG